MKVTVIGRVAEIVEKKWVNMFINIQLLKQKPLTMFFGKDGNNIFLCAHA